jgi:dienelactone hydrolase
MRRLIIFFISAACLSAQPRGRAVVIDGELNDEIWTHVIPANLRSVEPGVPEDGGEVRVRMSGKYLYLCARLPELSGRITARSIGKNPSWEEEDSVSFFIRVANENDWLLKTGPLGAYSVQWRWTGESEWYVSKPEKSKGFLVAAATAEKEWRVEVALPLSALGSPNNDSVDVSAVRVRAARPGTPEERWNWPNDRPATKLTVAVDDLPSPILRPHSLGNDQPPLQVGFRADLPSVQSGWNDDAWRRVPVWLLYRNEAAARLPTFPTEVKMLQDGHTLAVMARCAEPGEIVAAAQQRDGEVDQDDSFHVYLATSGSSYAKYAVNALGYVQDAIGSSGGPRISRPRVDWNSPVHASAWRGHEEWFVRIDLPLDFVATSLGEADTSHQWRILLTRNRPGRSGEPPETSVMPVTQTITPYCPARYRRLELVQKEPSELDAMRVSSPSDGLSFAPRRVLSAQQRKEVDLSGMLDRNIHGRTLTVLQAERRDWDRVRTLQDWEEFREPRWKALGASLGAFPARNALGTRVMKEFRGDGYRRQDLVYSSQPGVWVTANLYLPAESKERMPGIIIAHSLHWPKTQFELQDMGILWARGGCAVLIMDQAGYGERIEGYPWNRDEYHSRYITGMQLDLVGESLMKWMVWDIIRGIDLLLERKDIDDKEIVVLGSVAGGGDPAAVAAAIDPRVAAVVPFNFGESTPEIPRFIAEKNQWPSELADPGLGDWDTTRCPRRGVIDQFLQWTICAMAAPRRLVYSYELGWNVEDLPAWGRYKKVFELYHAGDHLADAHGFGPYPGPGECWNIGPAQRRSLYPTLERWFGIPVPLEQMTNSTRANLVREPDDRRPESELQVLTPATAQQLHMRTIHELALQLANSKLDTARAALAKMPAENRMSWLQSELAKRLGDIEPNPRPNSTLYWSKRLPNATVEGIMISVEPEITVPLLLFTPSTKGAAGAPIVVGVAEGGKELFLDMRADQIEALLKKGVAVCLPDVRGTGETTPDSRRDPENDENMQAVNEQTLGGTLLGRRLKDLRTVLAYLRTRKDLDNTRLGLWGESLEPVNPSAFVEDELPLWQVGPQIQQQGEPLGGLLAILGALYEPGVRTVAISNGLVSYSSILDDAFAYIPADAIVPGFLDVADLCDVEAALAPRPLLIEDTIDSRNRVISEERMRTVLRPLFDAYRGVPTSLSVRTGHQSSEIAAWMAAHF